MITAGTLNNIITFQRKSDSGEWIDYLSTYAYINGVSGTEFFIANAGYESSLTVTIQCRFQVALMRVTPNRYRVITASGIVYELLSPGDDVQLQHKEVKFRAKRIYDEEDGNIFED